MAPPKPVLRLVSCSEPGGEAPPAPAAPAEGPLNFEEIFRRYASMVATVGLRILGRRDELEDLVQDVFLDAHRGLAKIRHPEAVAAWLCTVTVRLARQRLRKRRIKRLFGLDEQPTYEDVIDEVGVAPDRRVLISEIYRLLDSLPVEQRLAWTLRFIDGEQLERVALLCDCSLATAKRRITEANRKLMEALFP